VAELRVTVHQSHHLMAGFCCFGGVVTLARHNPAEIRPIGSSRQSHLCVTARTRWSSVVWWSRQKCVDPFADGMRGQEIVDVGNVLCSYKAALAVGVQDPRCGNLDP